MKDFSIAEWEVAAAGLESRKELDRLAEVLRACVHAGASVNFVLPFPLEEARAFWRDVVAEEVRRGRRRVLVARRNGQIVGTVQVAWAPQPNQRHRAEVMKLLVHPEARRLGIARALMTAAESVARAAGRTLLTLDTRTGDHAEPLYVSMGYVAAGVIPRYSRAVDTPELQAATILYKELP